MDIYMSQNVILFQDLLRRWKNYWQVKQLLAVDGRLHLDFSITSTGSSQNYTRSYYMNGRDYVISGSCDEHVVRICCAQTGRRLRDVSLEVTWFIDCHTSITFLAFLPCLAYLTDSTRR